MSTCAPSSSPGTVAAASDAMCQPAPPRTSRSVSSETAGRYSSPTGLASEKQLSNRVAPGRVTRCTAAA